MKNRHLKLTIEFVPLSAWGQNIRSKVKRSLWEKIRKDTIAKHAGKCAICGAGGKLYCHEVWSYQDRTRVQKLTALEPLCWACHRVKHLGSTELLIASGRLSESVIDRLIRHFMRVNNCDRKVFETHRVATLKFWKTRSKHHWTLDLGEYDQQT